MIEKWYSPPPITIKGVQTLKSEDEWDENNVKRDSKMLKQWMSWFKPWAPINLIECNCETAKEIWYVLQVIQESKLSQRI